MVFLMSPLGRCEGSQKKSGAQEQAQKGYEVTKERVNTYRAGQDLLDKGEHQTQRWGGDALTPFEWCSRIIQIMVSGGVWFLNINLYIYIYMYTYIHRYTYIYI